MEPIIKSVRKCIYQIGIHRFVKIPLGIIVIRKNCFCKYLQSRFVILLHSISIFMGKNDIGKNFGENISEFVVFVGLDCFG